MLRQERLTTRILCASKAYLSRRVKELGDTVSAEEYMEELQLAFTAISEKLDGNDQVMLKGVLMFCDRVKK